MTTHYMEEAAELSDHIAIMDHGKVIALGTGKREEIREFIDMEPAPGTFEKPPGSARPISSRKSLGRRATASLTAGRSQSGI